MFHICFCLEKHMLYIEWLNIYFSKLKIATRQHRDSVLVREDRRKTRFEKFRPQTGLDVWVDGPRLLTLIREWTWSLSQVFFFSPFSHLLNAGPGTVTSWRRHGACSAPEFWKKWMFAPFFAHIRVFWAIFRGFPTTLVMCAAGDGGHATLILLPGSGKYPASLCRRKTTKSWVWLRLQPPGLAAPAEHVQESQPAPIFPRMTLSSLLPHAFSPRPQPVKETCVSLDVLWTEWPGDGDTSSMVT